MNRQEVAKLLPIIKAFSEGKTIQHKDYNMDGTFKWEDLNEEDDEFDWHGEYRIKPSPTYRPFANAEECWKEMLKHQPFGWVVKQDKDKELIAGIRYNGVQLHNQKDCYYDFEEANRILTFADGSVFGIKWEE